MERNELKNGTILRFPGGQSFEILRSLGGGGSALLYEAREMGSELHVAIKELYPAGGFVRRQGQVVPVNGGRSLENLKRSLETRESRLSQRAGRRNYQVLFSLPPVWHQVDIRLPDGTWLEGVENTCVRMDSLREKGRPLAEVLHQARAAGGLSADTALEIMETVLDAYAALHEDGVIHGDCQKGNLFLLRSGSGGDGVGTACIIDFGSARELLADGMTAPVTDELFSTDGYCAPELLLRDEDFRMSAACDVWSLGFLLLELLTDRGMEELRGITEYLIIHPGERRLTEGEAARLELSPARKHLLNHILKTALAPEPEERYADAGAMRRDLLRLKRCRELDVSHGLDHHLLWEASCRYRQKNPELFRTEHIPRLVDALPLRKLTVYGRLDGRGDAPAAELLRMLALGLGYQELTLEKPERAAVQNEWMDSFAALFGSLEKPSEPERPAAPETANRNVYLHAPGGAGKSFAAAQLCNDLLESGERVPLYLDLAQFTEEAFRNAGEQTIAALLIRQYFGLGAPALAEALCVLLRETDGEEQFALVLDNLHKVPKDLYHEALRAVNHISEHWKNTWLLVTGRAEDLLFFNDPTQERENPAFHPAHRLTLSLLPMEQIRSGVQAVWREKPNPYDPVRHEAIYGLQESRRNKMWSTDERALQERHDTLGLPLFFMRYLETFAAGAELYDPPESIAELLAMYFGCREYDAGARDLHGFLNRHMPAAAYRSMISGRPECTRSALEEWLRESYGRLRYRPECLEDFLYNAVEKLAILTAGSDGGYRFVHDCYQEYFAAAYIAVQLQQTVDTGESRHCAPINHRWPRRVDAFWPELCAGELSGGRFVRLCGVSEFLDQLYVCLKALPETEMQYARRIPRNAASACTEAPLREEWLALGAELGDVELQLRLAEKAWEEKDYQTAVAWYERSVRNGSLCGRKRLGDAYACGRGVSQDWEQAVQRYREAAEQGHGAAQVSLGFALACGRAAEADPVQAAAWFRRAAEQGNCDGQAAMGYSCLYGEGVPRDPEQALYWLKKTRTSHAAYYLGRMYEEGLGVPRDERQARAFYRTAGRMLHPDAFYRSGYDYLRFSPNPEEDPLLTESFYLRAARQGHAGEMYSLGFFYDRVCGMPQEAVAWYEKAAKQGHPAAQKCLADCLLEEQADAQRDSGAEESGCARGKDHV